MNPQTQEALKMAIEAMQSAYSSHGKILPSYPAQDAWMFHGCDEKLSKSLQACKEALAQPAQEPVAWLNPSNGAVICKQKKKQIGLDGKVNGYLNFSVPLTDHPALAWQGLSDDEILVIYESMTSKPRIDGYEWDYARAIEQALKQKNSIGGQE